MATVSDLINKGESILTAYHKVDAKIDAKLLASHLLNFSSAELVLNYNHSVPDHITESYSYLIAKRARGIPLQYITKNQSFMGLEFYVDERVLIPRQDTEILVESLIELSKKENLVEALEIGTGSGCISISLAKFIKDIHITAIDISKEALEVAEKNMEINEIKSEQITLLESDLLEHYKAEEDSLDLVVSNPPYISKKETSELMEEVQVYEPRIALTDEADGLTFYKKISYQVKPYLKNGGILAFEIGYDQGKAVSDILAQEGYKDIQVIQDLCHKDRVIISRKYEVQ